jgi:hypothetical protein
MPRSSDTRPSESVRKEAQDLAKEMTRDALRAARVGYRLASRATKKALSVVEQAAKDLEKELR